MNFFENVLLIIVLIVISMFFSVSEISLAAARKTRLRQWADEGNIKARRVLDLQAKPGHFFTVVQIGLNAVAILAGIIGEPAFTPYYADLVGWFYHGEHLHVIAFMLSFLTITCAFILFADVIPKRLALLFPEKIAVRIIIPMLACVKLCAPLVWLFNGLANQVFRLFGISPVKRDEITAEDITAIVAAGAEAGVLQKEEFNLIENVFELESRTVATSMTARESIIWLPVSADTEMIRRTVADHPHSKFLVCDGNIDRVLGYVDTKDLLVRVLNQQPIALKTDQVVRHTLMIPDTLTLSEILPRFKSAREDFAVILNEYALVVGIITLNDVMSTVMGDLVSNEEEQIVKRDDQSWLIDGVTPVDDVLRALDIDQFPDSENYDTIAGFIMYMLRRIPKRTDCVTYSGYKFEVVDIDNYKIDVLLVTKLPSAPDATETVSN